MKIINLVKSEFIKNYSIKKMILIIIILILFSIGLTELMWAGYFDDSEYVGRSSYLKGEHDELIKKEDRTLEEDYILYSDKIIIESDNFIRENKIRIDTWKYEIKSNINSLLIENYAIELFKENKDNDVIKLYCKTQSDYHGDDFESMINYVCTQYKKDTLDDTYKDNIKKMDTLSELLKKDKYYLYIEYLLENGEISPIDKPIANVIISNKIIDDDDYRAFNFKQYSTTSYRVNYMKEEDYLVHGSGHAYVSSYKDQVRFEKYLIKESQKNKAIILYSSENNIPHDLSFNMIDTPQGSDLYITTKNVVNKIFHMSLLVLIIVSITSGGIVSREHDKGTIKNIITTPVKRWKILLSKFIYLILHTYIIWLMILIILSIYSGIRFGFKDLISPKLIYSNGHVIEVNYYLNLLKDMFLASIPVIALLSIMFFISTITLNTALTVSLTSVFTIMTPILYYLCSRYNLNFLAYTPFMYFDCGFIHDNQELYTNILQKTDINIGIGIFSSIITIVVLYIITNIIYIKRDIKN